MNTATEINARPQPALRVALDRNQKGMAEIDEALGDIESTLGILLPQRPEPDKKPDCSCCDAAEVNALVARQDVVCTNLARFVERLHRIGVSLKQMF